MDPVSPEEADAPGFHLVNVLVHAFTCAWSLNLFRFIFSGKTPIIVCMQHKSISNLVLRISGGGFCVVNVIPPEADKNHVDH